MRCAILNSSPLSRKGWVTITVPQRRAAILGEFPVFEADGRKFPAVRGRNRGVASTTYRVHADMMGNEQLTGELVESARDRTAFEPHPWANDNVQALVTNLGVRVNGQEFWGKTQVMKLVEQSDAHQRWHIRQHIPEQGFTFEGWMDIKHQDPVGKLYGAIIWSDRADPAPTKRVEFIALRCGEFIRLDLAKREKMSHTPEMDGDQWLNVIGANVVLGDGDAILFSGNVMFLPQDDKAREAAEAQLELGASPIHKDIESLQAAIEGDLIGLCLEQGNDWMASGSPKKTDDLERDRLQWRQMREQPAGLGGPRLFGLGDNPPGTGDKDDFGACHGSHLVHGMLDMVEAYRYTAYGEGLRGFCHYESDGRRLQPDLHTTWTTWSGVTHWHGGISPDTLGKNLALIVSRPHFMGMDRQHRSQNAWMAYMWVDDDPLMDFLLDHLLVTDLHDVREKFDQLSHARAEGRVIGAMAHCALIHRPAQWAQLMANIVTRQDANPKMAPGLPMRVLASHAPDGRKQVYDHAGKLVGTASMWEHGLAAVGMANDEATRGGNVFRGVLETLARWGCFEESGKWHIVEDIAYADGAALTDPLSTTNPMVLTGANGVSEWTLYGIGVAAAYLPPGALKDKAAACWSALAGPIENRRQACWRAGIDRVM